LSGVQASSVNTRCPSVHDDRSPARDLEEENSMNDTGVDRLLAQARAGQISRRRILETGLRLGLATPAILALVNAAPRSAAAAPESRNAGTLAPLPAQDGSSGTLQVLITVGTEDIDPHFSYATLSSSIAL